MKVGVSIPDEDVAFIDDYARRSGIRTRSAVLHHAIGLLKSAELENAYTEAWTEWDGSDDAMSWDSTAADGISDATR
jgi:hypothetical protein